MTDPTAFPDRVRDVFRPSPRGVLGLVDDLLALGRELRVDYRDASCTVSTPGADPVDVALPKSVFRAALARVAVLCNERAAGSATPYQGAGELAGPGGPVRVAFTNTSGEQRLEVTPASVASTRLPAGAGAAHGGIVAGAESA